ncbi:MAG TPA: hypothetical protein VFU73_05835 [Actinocrinis sp.]|nr:hypothetical protein [Actinocrinis sp.]
MGFVGVTALSLLCAGPAARRLGPDPLAAVTRRLARAAVLLGTLAVPAILTGLAHSGKSGGYHYSAAWNSLYDGSVDGLFAGPARPWLLTAGLAAGAGALAVTKFPDKVAGAGWAAVGTMLET